LGDMVDNMASYGTVIVLLNEKDERHGRKEEPCE
jgi:hypothetical protein